MKNRRFLGLVFALLLACLLSIPVIGDYLLVPAATAVWLFLRTFILSIDQKVIWGILLYGIALGFLYRIVRRSGGRTEPGAKPPANTCIEIIGIRRNYFASGRVDAWHARMLRQELTGMLVTMYASGKHVPADYRIYDAFRAGEIPLPDRVRAFLFPAERKGNRFDVRAWVHRVTGREYEEFTGDLEETLETLENFMEMRNER